MGAFDLIRIAGSGLGMHQTWLDALAHNIANSNTARPTNAPAFQARFVMAQADEAGGVRISGTALGDPAGRLVHDPSHPMADEDGNVRMPEIDMAREMSQLIMAQRGFQAQAAVIRNAQDIYSSALSIGRSS